MADKKRAIYEEDLLAALRDDPHINGMNFARVRRHVNEAPSVEAVEVVHGRWIPLEADGYADGSPVWDLWECSECREEHSGDEDTLTPYCPNCGAKMDGGNDNA